MGKAYKTVLVAVELHEKTDKEAIEKAIKIAQPTGAKVHLVHAIEAMNYGMAYDIAPIIDVEAVLEEEAQKRLTAVAGTYHIPDTHLHILRGPAKHVILEEAKEIGADVIVVGSHGRHGVRLLLGSTANGILHGAECDVLAVRVND